MTPARILPPRQSTPDTTPARVEPSDKHWRPPYYDETGIEAIKRIERDKWKPKPHQAVRHIRRGRRT